MTINVNNGNADYTVHTKTTTINVSGEGKWTDMEKTQAITISVPEALRNQVITSECTKYVEDSYILGVSFIIPFPNYMLNITAYEDGTSFTKRM